MSDCFEYTPQPAPPSTSGSDPGLDIEVVALGCVLDVDGASLGPVFYQPTFDAETGAVTGYVLVHIPIATGVPVSPYVGPWGSCPAGPTSQLATIVTDFCAVANGAGYAIGDSVRLTRIIDLADPIGTPRVQGYSNLSAGVDQIIYLEENGVPIFGTTPPNTDFGTCAEPLPSLVRWSCLCDDGAVGVKAWQQFQSADNGLTWTLLGTFTEQYGAVPYVPVGVLVNCCDIGTAPTGKRARRTVLGVGSTVVPTGLPLVGALVESLSWSSRNATGTITDAAGTVSSFVAGEGGTWELEWIDTMTFDVTTGEVVIDWIEVY